MPPLRAAIDVSLSPLAEDVARFLRARGFVLHKCCTPGGDGEVHSVGGVCLTDEPGGGVLLGWSPHPALVHESGTVEKADVVAEMLAVFRAWLSREGFHFEMGPVGRSLRVLDAPESARGLPVLQAAS